MLYVFTILIKTLFQFRILKMLYWKVIDFETCYFSINRANM